MKVHLILLKIGSRGLLKSFITNLSFKFRIKNGGSNVADLNTTIYTIRKIIGIKGFSRSLITNLPYKLRNSKWWIQYGVTKCKN